MKRTVSILLLILLCFCMSGSYIAFLLRKSELKSEIRAYLRSHPEAGGEILAFNQQNGEILHNDFSWEEDHEFMFRGEMYDVISSETVGNKISFHCVKDKAENELIAWFRTAVRKNHNGNDKNGFKIFSPVFPELQTGTFVRNNFVTCTTFSASRTADLILKGHTRSDDQPPQA